MRRIGEPLAPEGHQLVVAGVVDGLGLARRLHMFEPDGEAPCHCLHDALARILADDETLLPGIDVAGTGVGVLGTAGAKGRGHFIDRRFERHQIAHRLSPFQVDLIHALTWVGTDGAKLKPCFAHVDIAALASETADRALPFMVGRERQFDIIDA